MAKIIDITNGQGSSDIVNGSYSVVADVNGYDNSSILPNNVDIVDGTNEYNFTIGANGTLTLHVSEDGTETGTPVVGATFVRTDALGNEYGNVITSDASGNAVFDNVPFAATSAPTVYYKQTASDGEHEFSDAVASTTLTTDTQTVEVINSLGALRTIELTDSNYQGLPIDSATLTLNND